jgi:type III secretion protein C
MIELLTSITENISLYKTSETDRLDVKVFHLKHAWADDKEIGGLKIPGVATLLDNILGKQENTENALKSASQTASAKKVTSLREKDTDEKNKKATPKENEKTDEKAENSDEGSDKIKSDGGVITVDPRQNAVIVKDYRHKLPMYQELIDLLDVPTELIEIQAAIVNVSKGCDFKIGSDKVTISSTRHSDRTWFSYKPVSTNDTGLNVQLNGVVNGIQFMTAINALASKNLSKVLARPSVLTMNNLTAVMEQGKTYYLEVKGNKAGDMYSVEANTNLKVTPHLLAKDGQTCIQLILDIKDESFSAPEGNVRAGTDTSSIATQALVYEGQSILVGGYFAEGYEDGDSGVPVLKDVPVLGHLFKNYSKKKTISERLFLITPKIIRLSASDPYGGLFKTPSNLTDSRELMQIQCRQGTEQSAEGSDKTSETSPLETSVEETPKPPKKMSRTARLFAKRHKKDK